MLLKHLVPLLVLASGISAYADPQISSWQTSISAKYARIYSSTANRTAGTSETTWTNGTISQTSAAYSGVNEIDASTDFVYILSTGLGGQVMGPWSNPNLPKNQQDLWRFPPHADRTHDKPYQLNGDAHHSDVHGSHRVHDRWRGGV